MRWVGVVVGVLLALIGAVWLLQGLNVLPGSGMSGQSFWAIAGVVALAVGLAIFYLGVRGGRVASHT